MRAVPGQPAIAHLGVTKLAFYDTEGMPHLRAHAGFAALPALLLRTVACVLHRCVPGRHRKSTFNHSRLRNEDANGAINHRLFKPEKEL